MGINRAIDRLGVAFVLLFLLLGARAVWVQVIAGPRIAQNAHNPRLALLERYRGSIVARDGTILAASTAKGRTYPYGAMLAHAVGYDSLRYGTAGLERAFDAELSAPVPSLDPSAQVARLVGDRQHAGPVHGSDVVTTIDVPTQEALYAALSEHARRGRRTRSADGRGPRHRERAVVRPRRPRRGVRAAREQRGEPVARSRDRRAVSAGFDVQDIHGRGGARQRHGDPERRVRGSRLPAGRHVRRARRRERGDRSSGSRGRVRAFEQCRLRANRATPGHRPLVRVRAALCARPRHGVHAAVCQGPPADAGVRVAVDPRPACVRTGRPTGHAAAHGARRRGDRERRPRAAPHPRCAVSARPAAPSRSRRTTCSPPPSTRRRPTRSAA